MNIYIYTDGACSGNPGPGGYGFVGVNENDQELFSNYGGERQTTNNRMEMTGIIKALEFAKAEFPNDNITILTDSAYCHNCYNQKWYANWERNNWENAKHEPVKNRDLWEKLIPYFKNTDIQFIKVKGHSTVKWNNEADRLAVQGRIEQEVR